MAPGHFYVIYINRLPSATLDQVKTKMDHSLYWYRVEESVWIVYTNSDAERWHTRLAPLVTGEGLLFICKLDITSRQGWMKKDFWSWMRSEQPEA